MGIIQLERRYSDVEPYYYEPWWDRTSDATRIGIYVAIVILVVLAVGCVAYWITLNHRRSAPAPYAPQPAYTGTRPNTHVSPWNENGYSTLNGSKESLDAYNVPKPPPRAYSYAEPDGSIQKDEIRAVLYKYDKN